jgi:hypothetical protein
MHKAALDRQITKDLIRKGSEDIGLVVQRLHSIAPKPFMPIAVAMAGAAIIPLAMELAVASGAASPEPDPECMLLAALLAARCGLRSDDPIGAAYADLEALKSSGRLPAARQRHDGE